MFHCDVRFDNFRETSRIIIAATALQYYVHVCATTSHIKCANEAHLAAISQQHLIIYVAGHLYNNIMYNIIIFSSINIIRNYDKTNVIIVLSVVITAIMIIIKLGVQLTTI